MNKKVLIPIIACTLLTGSMAFGAKYTVNKSGTVKTQTGQVITSPANSVNQNYYNNYTPANYINTNAVNRTQVGTIEIVMDFSGSMSNWITAAKRSMSAIVAQIPASTNVGFRVFGHDSNGSNPTSIHTLQDVKKIVKAVLTIIAIVFTYLFLLNGRYADIDHSSCFDKWTGKRIEIEWKD